MFYQYFNLNKNKNKNKIIINLKYLIFFVYNSDQKLRFVFKDKIYFFLLPY